MSVGFADAPPWAALYVPAELDVSTVEDFAEILTRQNVRYLMAHPETPLLYQSGAFYRIQPEYWLSIPWALQATRQGRGVDCKVLAAWRAAELRVFGGEPYTRCVGSEHPTPTEILYHVRVLRQDGRLEDPSAALGMRSVTEGSKAWSPSLLSR